MDQEHWPILFFFVGIGISGWVHRFPKLLAGLLKVSQWLFAPVFFISVGMKIHFQENFSWEQFLFVLALAIFSKVVGVYGVARWAKHTKSDSFLMAVVLNARGAMEVLYASLALSLGMINETLFTSLVLMAVVSSIMAAPAARHWRSV